MQLQLVQNRIFQIRGSRIMLDFHLAELYQVETRALKQAVKRNLRRFPPDFMFKLSKHEWQEVITNCDNLPGNVKYSPATPLAFTEQGVAMLSSVLKSKKAVDVNIAIMRAFMLLRQHLTDYRTLKEQLQKLQKEMNLKFKNVNEVLQYLLSPASKPREIGFRQKARRSYHEP